MFRYTCLKAVLCCVGWLIQMYLEVLGGVGTWAGAGVGFGVYGQGRCGVHSAAGSCARVEDHCHQHASHHRGDSEDSHGPDHHLSWPPK